MKRARVVVRACLACLACAAAASAGCASQAPPRPRLVLAEAAPAETVPPAGVPPAPTKDHARQRTRTLGWVSLAVGAEAAVVAVATSFVMLHDQSQRDSNCDGHKVCSQAGFDANSNLTSLGGWNAGAWVVAAVGLGAGAFLLLTSSADDAHQTAIGVTPGGLTLRSRF